MEMNGTEIVSPASVRELLEMARQGGDMMTPEGEEINPGIDILEEIENQDDKTKEDIEERILSKGVQYDERNEEEGNQSSSEVVSIISYLSDKFGIDDSFLQNEEFIKKPLQDILDFVYAEAEKKILEKNKDRLYKTELSYELDNYLSNGGRIESFFSDFITASKELNDQLEVIREMSDKELLYADFINKGFSEEEAIEFVDDLEKKGKIHSKAQVLRDQIEKGIELIKQQKLKEILEDQNQNLKAINEKELEQIEKEKIDLANRLSSINSILNFPITEKQKEELFDFITETDEQGYTKLDRALQSNENLIFVSFLLLYGNDFINYLQTFFKERSKRIFYDKLLKEPIISQPKTKLSIKDDFNVQKLNEF